MQTARRDWVLELGGNIAERIAQVGADQLERGDGGDGDQCRDQSILNGRDPGIVPAQVPKWRVGYHRLFLQLSGGTRRFLHKSYSKIMFTLLSGGERSNLPGPYRDDAARAHRPTLWGDPIVDKRIAVALRVHHAAPGSTVALPAAVPFPVHPCSSPGQASAGEPLCFCPSRCRSRFLDPHRVA